VSDDLGGGGVSAPAFSRAAVLPRPIDRTPLLILCLHERWEPAICFFIDSSLDAYQITCLEL
jgi:hypothetical protein